MPDHSSEEPAPTHRQPQIILITGTMAAGKSSVAQALAEQLPWSVHLRGDLFRRMIVNGQADMASNLSAEASAQLRLRYQMAVAVAKLYVHAGFTVVHQDIILGPALAEVVQAYHGETLSIIVLCPTANVVAARDRARRKTGYPNEATVQAFDRVLRTETPHLGYWLDTSDLTVVATVEHILEYLSQTTMPNAFVKL